jgi:hypothetical protein
MTRRAFGSYPVIATGTVPVQSRVTNCTRDSPGNATFRATTSMSNEIVSPGPTVIDPIGPHTHGSDVETSPLSTQLQRLLTVIVLRTLGVSRNSAMSTSISIGSMVGSGVCRCAGRFGGTFAATMSSQLSSCAQTSYFLSR